MPDRGTETDSRNAIFSIGKKKVFNAMHANAENIKKVAKIETYNCLPFEIRQLWFFIWCCKLWFFKQVKN